MGAWEQGSMGEKSQRKAFSMGAWEQGSVGEKSQGKAFSMGERAV